MSIICEISPAFPLKAQRTISFEFSSPLMVRSVLRMRTVLFESAASFTAWLKPSIVPPAAVTKPPAFWYAVWIVAALGSTLYVTVAIWAFRTGRLL